MKMTLLHPTPPHPPYTLLAMGKTKYGTTTKSQCLTESLRLILRIAPRRVPVRTEMGHTARG